MNRTDAENLARSIYASHAKKVNEDPGLKLLADQSIQLCLGLTHATIKAMATLPAIPREPEPKAIIQHIMGEK